jgi:hypothetical protein
MSIRNRCWKSEEKSCWWSVHTLLDVNLCLQVTLELDLGLALSAQTSIRNCARHTATSDISAILVYL